MAITVLADRAERLLAVWVAAELGRSDEAVAAQAWLLFEGTAVASTAAGVGVAAKDTATVLVSASRGCGRG